MKKLSVIRLKNNSYSKVVLRTTLIHGKRLLIILVFLFVFSPIVAKSRWKLTVGGALMVWLIVFVENLIQLRHAVQEIRYLIDDDILLIEYTTFNREKVKSMSLESLEVEFSHLNKKSISKDSSCCLNFSSNKFRLKIYDSALNNIENYSRLISSGIISMNYNSRAFLKKCSQSKDVELQTLAESLLQ